MRLTSAYSVSACLRGCIHLTQVYFHPASADGDKGREAPRVVPLEDRYFSLGSLVIPDYFAHLVLPHLSVTPSNTR
jgi:hypothetical protein